MPSRLPNCWCGSDARLEQPGQSAAGLWRPAGAVRGIADGGREVVLGGQSELVELVRQTPRGYSDQAGSRHVLLSSRHQPADQCGGYPSALPLFQTLMARSFALLLVWSLLVTAMPVSAQADDVI